MVAKSAAFLVPTATVPMPSQIWSILRHDDEMSDARLNDRFASGAHIRFERLVRLHGMDNIVVEFPEDSQCIYGRGFATYS